jgi:hypothetical protein
MGMDMMSHYMFVESENDPANDPVLLWSNGGPGKDEVYSDETLDFFCYSFVSNSLLSLHCAIAPFRLRLFTFSLSFFFLFQI